VGRKVYCDQRRTIIQGFCRILLPCNGSLTTIFYGTVYMSNTAGVLYEAGNCLPTWVHPCFFRWGPCCSSFRFCVWCPITSLYAVSSVLWCPLRFPHTNGGLMSYLRYCLRIAVSNTHWPNWVVVLFCFSSFCVPMWCQVLWIVPFLLSLRYSLTFIYYSKQKIQK
jgi:hypothetical protein